MAVIPSTNYSSLPVQGNTFTRAVDTELAADLQRRIQQEQLRQSQITNQFLPRNLESLIRGREINNEYAPREKDIGLRQKLADALAKEIDNKTLDARNIADLNLHNAQAEALPLTSRASLMRAIGYGPGSGRLTAKNADQYYTSHPEELNSMFDRRQQELTLSPQQQVSLQQAGIAKPGVSTGMANMTQLPMTSQMGKMANQLSNLREESIQPQENVDKTNASQTATITPGSVSTKLNYDINNLSVPALNQLATSMMAENSKVTTKPQQTLGSTALTFKKTLDKYEDDFLKSADLVAEYAGNPIARKRDLLTAYAYRIRGKDIPTDVMERIEADKKYNSYVEFLAEVTGKMEGTSIARESKMDVKDMLAFGGMGKGATKESAQRYVRNTLDRVRTLIDERIEAAYPKWSLSDIEEVRDKMSEKQGIKKNSEGYTIGPDGKLNIHMTGSDFENHDSSLAKNPAQAFESMQVGDFISDIGG